MNFDDIKITPHNLFTLFILLFKIAGVMVTVWNQDWRTKIYLEASLEQEKLNLTISTVSFVHYKK